jgi:hypothetical protein
MLEIGKDRIEDLFEITAGISIATKRENVSLYDFDFRSYFQVNTIFRETKGSLILRIGAINDYEKVYNYFEESGLKLINSVEEHNKVSLLPNWYGKIQELTPKSIVFETLPTFEQIEDNFIYPIFIKGERQTNKHKKELCVAESRSDFERISIAWISDPILSWQKMIVREFVELMPIEKESKNQLQKSYEIRVFVWFGNILSMGQYWESEHKIKLDGIDEDKIIELTKIVYEKLLVPFIVIDFAKTISNEWIVIELNDAQESGYAMNSKINLWSRLIEIEINKKYSSQTI